MTDRKKSSSRLPPIKEENAATHRDLAELIVAPPVPRSQTPVGMPAPPPEPAIKVRESSDDLERVVEQDKFERERVRWRLKEQELEEENTRLRKEGRTEVFPPESIPPAANVPVISSGPTIDYEKLQKQIAKSKLGRAAAAMGILAALGGNAYNWARATVPERKAEAASAKVDQNTRLTEEQIAANALEKQRTLQALRALKCYSKQTRGGFQRQGLDLTSLPGGGIKVLQLRDDDPNHPGAPRFIADEKCPDFPELPPEIVR